MLDKWKKQDSAQNKGRGGEMGGFFKKSFLNNQEIQWDKQNVWRASQNYQITMTTVDKNPERIR